MTSGILVGVLGMIIFLGSFCTLSYFLLKKLGVKEHLAWRASKFGLSLASIQIFVQLVASTLTNSSFGSLAVIFVSYFYVRSVLNIQWKINVAIIILLPILSGLLAAPLLLVLFNNT
ncbi:hypothetical protein [Candidatus Pelagadaptatus aseana]|uniref:hypothetical protein n=1 Tax=Candidatus Pelagadaptatus aseana TaxID=3120508 RepID=UPI003C6EC52B